MASKYPDLDVAFLLYKGTRLMQRMYRPYLDEWGITYPQYLVLRLLWERNGQSVSELCVPLDLDSGTLSPLLKRLEATGLIERRRLDTDYRVLKIHLQERGRALEVEAKRMHREVTEALGLKEEDREALEAIVTKISPSGLS